MAVKAALASALIIGPFAVKDSVTDFDHDALKGEADVEPAPKKKIGDHEWKAASVPPDDFMVFGTAELP